MPVYSHSRLSTYEKCPLQYRYRYLDRIKRDTQSIEAFLGNRVHDVLETLYRRLMASERPSLDELVALYHRGWEEAYSEKITIVKTERGPDHYRGVGERCLTGYYRRYEPFDQAATVGVEERVQVALDAGGRYQLQGYVDRLARGGDGAYEIHDYKTSSNLPSDGDLRRDRQLTVYQMAVQRRFPDARAIRLVWHYLAFDLERISARTPAEIESHRRAAMRLIDTIEAAADFPPKVSALCRWCEYRDICPAQKDLLEAEVPSHAARAVGRAPEPQARPKAAPSLDRAEQIELFD